jgi:hypothetical protein
MVARRRLGEYSAVNEEALGMAPPSPSPVRNLSARSMTKLVDPALASVRMLNSAAQIRMIMRRP